MSSEDYFIRIFLADSAAYLEIRNDSFRSLARPTAEYCPTYDLATWGPVAKHRFLKYSRNRPQDLTSRIRDLRRPIPMKKPLSGTGTVYEKENSCLMDVLARANDARSNKSAHKQMQALQPLSHELLGRKIARKA